MSQINDGYDEFAIDNTRTTQSDQPGRDTQHSTGAAAEAEVHASADALRLTTIATYADSPMNYAYDGDWGNPAAMGAVHLPVERGAAAAPHDAQSGAAPRRGCRARAAAGSSASMRWTCANRSPTRSINLYQDPTSDYLPPAATTVTTSQYETHSTGAVRRVRPGPGPRAGSVPGAARRASHRRLPATW